MTKTRAAIAAALFAVLGCALGGIAFAGGSKGPSQFVDDVFAAASGGPPPIDDILGTWTFSDRRTAYQAGVPGPIKLKETFSFVITKTSPTEVYLSLGRRAHYINGILIVGAGIDAHDPLEEVVLRYFEVREKPGHLVMTGKEYFDTTSYGEAGAWVSKGKQGAFAPLSRPVLASPVAEASSAPPTIDQLDGTSWVLKGAGTEYDLSTGEKMPLSGTEPWTIDKIDATTVVIHAGGAEPEDLTGYYEGGLLLTGSLNDLELASEAFIGYLVVSGSPGNMVMKGEFASYDVALDYKLEAGKISCKQQ